MNHTFYIRLYVFGQYVNAVSQKQKVDLNNYFDVVHPGVPVIKPKIVCKPELQYTADCPPYIRLMVDNLYQQAFSR
jgi:hypothetical protein